MGALVVVSASKDVATRILSQVRGEGEVHISVERAKASEFKGDPELGKCWRRRQSDEPKGRLCL